MASVPGPYFGRGGRGARGGRPAETTSVQEMLAAEMAEGIREERAAAEAARRADRGPPPRRGAPREAVPDIHELMKAEAYRPEPGYTNRATEASHFDRGRAAPTAVHGASDQHLLLDSWIKNRNSRVDAGVFAWDLMVQGATGDENVGVTDTLENVIEIQVGSFSVPMLPEVPYLATATVPGTAIPLAKNNTGAAAPTLVPNTQIAAAPTNRGQYPLAALSGDLTTVAATPWINNPYTQTPCGNRISIQLREAGKQAYVGRAGALSHFNFQLAWDPAGMNPNVLRALPIAGGAWDVFEFTEPLRDLLNVTLQFRNPDTPLAFEPDVFYSATAERNADGFLRINVKGHNLLAGDRIFLRRFASTGPSNPQLDAYMNRPEGHVVNDPAVAVNPGMPLSTPNQMGLDPAVNLTAFYAAGAIVAADFDVYIAKRRILIPMRVRKVVQRLTNYKSP